MTLRLTLISPDDEDFILEMKIDADATFADLHRLILSHCGYDELQGQRFFICDERWKPYRRILLSDEDANLDEDIYLMADTHLGDFLEDEGQRFAYRFDPEERRMFLLEVTETTFGERTPSEGILTRRSGATPSQYLQEETPQTTTPNVVSEELEEEFYGEDGFEEEDLDLEGFDILE